MQKVRGSEYFLIPQHISSKLFNNIQFMKFKRFRFLINNAMWLEHMITSSCESCIQNPSSRTQFQSEATNTTAFSDA